MLLFVGCAEETAPPASGGIGKPPGTITGGGGTGGMGGMAGAGGAGGATNGLCNDESDLDAIEGAGASLRDIASDCGLTRCANFVGSGPAYEACINNCVESDVVGLSSECATCYGGLERCAYDGFCFESCRFDTCSTFCIDCLAAADCILEFEECRGLPGDGCPDA